MSGFQKFIASMGGRKFIMAVAGVVAVVCQEKFGISEDQVMYIAGIVATYIGGQGFADGMSKGVTSSVPTGPEVVTTTAP